MYVYKYSVNIYLLCMIKFRVRWCTCSIWRMLLPCGKLIGLLLFSLLLLFLLFKTNVHTYIFFQGNELTRPVVGMQLLGRTNLCNSLGMVARNNAANCLSPRALALVRGLFGA